MNTHEGGRNSFRAVSIVVPTYRQAQNLWHMAKLFRFKCL